MPRRTPKPVKFEKELVFADRNFPLAVFILDEHPDYLLHVHDFSEIVIIAHGHGVNVVGNKEFPLKAGDVFVHHGGRPHGYRDTKNLGLINVIYEQSLLQKVRFDVAGLPGYQSLFVVEPAMRRKGEFERHLTLGIRDLARARELAEAMEKELYGDAPRMRPVAFEERRRSRSLHLMMPTHPDHSSSHSVLPRGAIWPFALLASCFLWWGIANNLTDPLVKFFKEILGMSTFQASLIQMAFYGGYFCMALPGAMIARPAWHDGGIVMPMIAR